MLLSVLLKPTRLCMRRHTFALRRAMRMEESYNGRSGSQLKLFSQTWKKCGGRGQCVHACVINDLNVDVLVGSKYAQSWSLWSSITLQQTNPPDQSVRLWN